MMEQGIKSSRKLSVKVYDVVKALFDNQAHQDYFWSLLVACTAYSRVNCTRAHHDFYQTTLEVIYASLQNPNHGITEAV